MTNQSGARIPVRIGINLAALSKPALSVPDIKATNALEDVGCGCRNMIPTRHQPLMARKNSIISPLSGSKYLRPLRLKQCPSISKQDFFGTLERTHREKGLEGGPMRTRLPSPKVPMRALSRASLLEMISASILWKLCRSSAIRVAIEASCDSNGVVSGMTSKMGPAEERIDWNRPDGWKNEGQPVTD